MTIQVLRWMKIGPCMQTQMICAPMQSITESYPCNLGKIVKTHFSGAKGTVQWLRTLAALLETRVQFPAQTGSVSQQFEGVWCLSPASLSFCARIHTHEPTCRHLCLIKIGKNKPLRFILMLLILSSSLYF